ncbi:riboflavin biosynthesis protein RibD [Gammaproteobacteria bacterium 42_54_T18]|nr:riboflavin biosynthesis protein RibD [Gammaproteobacteria bacterium 42_54_T18]
MKPSAFSTDDTRYMARAIQIARQGLYSTHPNPRVGCVVVNDGHIVGEGWHQVACQGHAEVNALAQAGDKSLGATAYVTLEPCSHFGRTPPCSQALIDAGISRVVGAMQDPNPLVSGNGFDMLREQGVDVSCGLLTTESEQLNPGFIKRMSVGKPWVRVKSAMSADGRTAMASGESQWITGAGARQDVQRLRARSEAIITGVDSVLIDDPSLTVRPETWANQDEWPNILAEPIQPLRVILDSQLRTPVTGKMLTLPGNTLIVCAVENKQRQAALEIAGAEVLCLPSKAKVPKVDLCALLAELARREVNEVLVETGATTAGAFVQQGLVDEWVLYMAPTLMGSDARPVLLMPGIDTMKNKLPLTMKGVKQVGDDLCIHYTIPCALGKS